MLIPKMLSPDVASRESITSGYNYDELLRRTEEQRLIAREMVERARDMIADAIAMRKCSYRPLLPLTVIG